MSVKKYGKSGKTRFDIENVQIPLIRIALMRLYRDVKMVRIPRQKKEKGKIGVWSQKDYKIFVLETIADALKTIWIEDDKHSLEDIFGPEWIPSEFRDKSKKDRLSEKSA